ncbi:MAG: hypothetical protein ACK5PB_22195 [Pirellula sp.]
MAKILMTGPAFRSTVRQLGKTVFLSGLPVVPYKNRERDGIR